MPNSNLLLMSCNSIHYIVNTLFQAAMYNVMQY